LKSIFRNNFNKENEYLFLADSSPSNSTEDKAKPSENTQLTEYPSAHIVRVYLINVIRINSENILFRFYQQQVMFHSEKVLVMIHSVHNVFHVKSAQHYY